MIKQFHANAARLRRHQRLRRRLAGTEFRPRLSVFRSGHHIYAQVIDDSTGVTLAAASSLDASLKDFKVKQGPSLLNKPASGTAQPTQAESVEAATETAPAAKSKGAKAEKAPAKGTQKGAAPAGKSSKTAQPKTVLPTAQKGEAKTPLEALAAISNNRKVALAREVGKLVAQRAKEKGVARVVFDRGGYAYHGRIAALAEGAREVGLDF